MDDNILTLKEIDKVYGTGELQTQILFGIDLEFKAGSFNSIIGQSGSGKSTLMNIMGTLDRPSGGIVTIDGKETQNLSKNKLAEIRNQTIGFVFQFHYLLPEFTALENVLMPYVIKNNHPSPEILKRAHELMEMVGLGQVKNNLSTKMSGGQQQRTAIARSLIMNPKIILADEPTGNLDSETTIVIYDIMRQINKDFKTTCIVITHDNKIAEKADRIVEIKDGHINLDIMKTVL